MRARVQSANPQIRSQSRPQSAYQVHRPRLLDNTAGSAAFKNGGTNQNKLKAKHDPVEILGRQQHLVTTQSDEQPLWIKEAITMVKNGKPTRLKIGTEAKQLSMAHENLAEEGKRLEVALRYVSQINAELLDNMADYERKMEEYEEMIEENHNLRHLMIPNGQSIEKMHEALSRDHLRLRKDLKQRQVELERLHRERLYSEYNEKMTDVREFTKECHKLKKKLEEVKRQTSQETIEQEQNRLNRNIERMKGQIKELVEEIKDLEVEFGRLSNQKPDRTTEIFNEVRELRKQTSKLSQVKSTGEAFTSIEANIRSYYKSMGFEVEGDVEHLLEDAKAYAVHPDSQKYLESPPFLKFKNSFILTLLAAEYLDFDNVVIKFEGEKDWPKKIAKYMSKDRRFSQYMDEREILSGLEAYQASGLRLKEFPVHFEIKDFSSTLPDKADLNRFSKISTKKGSPDYPIEKFLKLKPEEGGLGIKSEDEEVDLSDIVLYGYFASTRFNQPEAFVALFSALSQILRTKSSRFIRVSQLLEILKGHAEAEQSDGRHYIAAGVDSKSAANRGVKSAKIFDKSSELKLKEEEIPFTDGQDGRRSEARLDKGRASESMTILRLASRVLIALAACRVRNPERLFNLSLSLEERIKGFLKEAETSADSNAKTSEQVKKCLEKKHLKELFEGILEVNGIIKAPAAQQNECLMKEFKLSLLAGLPDDHKVLQRIKTTFKDNKGLRKAIDMKTGDQTEVSVLHIQEILSPESLKLEDFEVLSLQAFLFSKNSFKFDIQKDSLVQLLMAGHTSDHQQALVQPAAVQTKAKEDSQKAKPEEIPPKTKPPQPEKAAKDQPAPKPTNAKQPAQDDEREFDDFGDFEDEFG